MEGSPRGMGQLHVRHIDIGCVYVVGTIFQSHVYHKFKKKHTITTTPSFGCVFFAGKG